MAQFILGVNIRFISAMIPVSVFRTDNNFTDRRNFDMGAVDTVFCSVVAIADFRFQNRYAGNQRRAEYAPLNTVSTAAANNNFFITVSPFCR